MTGGTAVPRSDRSMARAGAAVLLLTLVAVAGCVRPPSARPPEPAGTACSTVSIPPARAGAEYVYEARGSMLLVGSDLMSAIDWEDNETTVGLPAGSRVRVAVGDRPVPAVDAFGRLRRAWQVTYWADTPDRPRVAAADQWIDAETGRLLSVTTRHNWYVRDNHTHLTRATRWNATGLLQMPMLWGRPLEEGGGATMDTPVFPVGPGSLRSGQVRYDVEAVSRDRGDCRATIRVVDTGSAPLYEEADPHAAELVVHDDRSLPTRYTYDGPGLKMQLVEAHPGEGPVLPTLRTGPRPASALARAPADGVAPAGGEELWPTSFAKAKRLAEQDDPVVGAWLRAHPRARVARVEHEMGHPTSPIVDQWEIVWLDPQGNRKATAVERHRSSNTTDDDAYDNDSYEVDMFEYFGKLRYPPEKARWPTLDAMAGLHSWVRGRPPDLLICEVWEDGPECWIGTHEGTMISRACEGPCPGQSPVGYGYQPGLTIDLERGRVITEQATNLVWPPPAGGDGA